MRLKEPFRVIWVLVVVLWILTWVGASETDRRKGRKNRQRKQSSGIQSDQVSSAFDGIRYDQERDSASDTANAYTSNRNSSYVYGRLEESTFVSDTANHTNGVNPSNGEDYPNSDQMAPSRRRTSERKQRNNRRTSEEIEARRHRRRHSAILRTGAQGKGNSYSQKYSKVNSVKADMGYHGNAGSTVPSHVFGATSTVATTTTIATTPYDETQEFYKTIPMETLNLWIDGNEIVQFLGVPMDIFVIREGVVVPYLQQAYLDQQLPVLPPEVHVVHLTWQAKDDTYYYNFTELRSLDPHTLYNPLLSVTPAGRVPNDRSEFQLAIPCTGNVTAIASMYIVLQVRNSKNRPVIGGPIKLHLRKRCIAIESRTSCHRQCANGGTCNNLGQCECQPGYYGENCEMAVCFPECQNNGSCVSPHECQCMDGYLGKSCELGICKQQCFHGGTCIHPEVCECPNGYYGNYCQHKTGTCDIACKNGGTCANNNRCTCPPGYIGEFCQIPVCKRSCGIHGYCAAIDVCVCHRGWRGRFCHKTVNRTNNKMNRRQRKQKSLRSRAITTESQQNDQPPRPQPGSRRRSRKHRRKGRKSTRKRPRVDV